MSDTRHIVLQPGETVTVYTAPRAATGITRRAWAALENAERILYRRLGSGYNGYTDVMPYESDDEFLGRIWDTATYAVEGSYENWDSYSESLRLARIAERVARTLLVLNFGPEALLM